MRATGSPSSKRKQSTGVDMHHHKLESELNHLEFVLRHAGRGPFPHTYWRERLAALPVAGANPTHHSRVERLKNFLASIENADALAEA